jgi:hypothetical protein
MSDALETGTLPELEKFDGYEGTLWLTDTANGKAILVGLWASEEARKAPGHWGNGAVPVSTQVGVDRELLGTFEVRLRRLPRSN